MDVNVALIPAAPLRAAMAELSARLAPVGNSLMLDPTGAPYPHLTLYLTGYEDDTVSTIPVLIQGNVADIRPPRIRVTGSVVTPQGTVLLNVEKTPELDHLHRWMIHKLNPLRMRARPQIWDERRERLGPAELDKLERLGFPKALESWSPHFTIGKIGLPLPPAEEVRELLGDVRVEGMADFIGIGTVGPHGSFTRMLGECRFA